MHYQGQHFFAQILKKFQGFYSFFIDCGLIKWYITYLGASWKSHHKILSGTPLLQTHILKGNYYIEIIDDGCGMDEDTLIRVKEMFFTTKSNGSGLGVSLSDEIVKGHGGSMDYYSNFGVGTRVVVKLPIIML